MLCIIDGSIHTRTVLEYNALHTTDLKSPLVSHLADKVEVHLRHKETITYTWQTLQRECVFDKRTLHESCNNIFTWQVTHIIHTMCSPAMTCQTKKISNKLQDQKAGLYHHVMQACTHWCSAAIRCCYVTRTCKWEYLEEYHDSIFGSFDMCHFSCRVMGAFETGKSGVLCHNAGGILLGLTSVWHLPLCSWSGHKLECSCELKCLKVKWQLLLLFAVWVVKE